MPKSRNALIHGDLERLITSQTTNADIWSATFQNLLEAVIKTWKRKKPSEVNMLTRIGIVYL